MMNSDVKIQTRIERVDMMTTMKANGKSNESGKQMGSLLDSQPWISTFKTMCITDQFSASSLNNLMAYFIRNVRTNVNECQTKPLRADKLRGFISETLLFFLYYCRAHEEKYDEAVYMSLVSDLLAMYIDTELKASKRSNECHKVISARIASCLHVYLGNSAEYLLDTLFKVRFMSSNYHQILHPIISKIFALIPEQPNSSLMYVRYFLVYRIWKRITKDQNAKNEINSKAMASLCSPPTSFPQHIMDYVLPKVPNTSQITSRYLLQQPIELAKSCESFVQFCRDSRGLRNAVEMEQNQSSASAESSELEDKLPCKLRLSISENSTTNNSLSIVDSSKQLNVKLNSEKNSNSKLSGKSPKKATLLSSSSNVMLIDLTSDDSPDRIIKHKIKTNQKRLSWTQSLLKKKSIVAVAADSNNEEYKNITEDLQPIEDTIKIQSLSITSNDSDWIIGLELSASEMAELNSPIANESTMKIDEFTTSNRLCEDLIGDPITIRVPETNELSQSLTIDEVTCQSEVKEILSGNTEAKPILQTRHVPIEDIGEVEVEVTTTDPHIDDATSEYIHNNINTINNENVVEVTPSSSDSDVKNDIKLNTLAIKTNTFTDLTGPARDTVLYLNKCLPSTDVKLNEIESSKIQDVEFHEHIDGLSLLASVSQRVSHLTTTSGTMSKTRDVIKVKDYHSLINFDNNIGDNEQHDLMYENKIVDNSDNVMNIFPDDDIDKVALHVEVTSSEDVFDQSCTSTIYKQEHINTYCSSNNEQSNELLITSMQVDSSIQSDKDDTNVILNGETIVLLQKSPNSNLYIINKAAVENREHSNDGDSENNLIEKNQTIDKVNDEMYSYEIYDSMYRMGQTASSKPSYELTQNSEDSSRATSIELKKNGKNKNNNEVMSPRRRRVKQEFNGCTNSTCQDLVDAHSIHIPSSTSLYHSNYATGDLFISCRPNCNSVACGMSVNHPTASIHSHNKSARCSCLNCAYDIVAHCSQCILPAGETKASKIDNGFYIPIQKPSVIQDCSLNNKCTDDKVVDMYDKKLLCKIETIDDEKSTEIYQSEINSKLPLKKRFKSMISVNFTDTSIKREKIAGNYPSTPMISIAALEPRENPESSSKLIAHQVKSKDIMRNSYTNEMLNGYHDYNDVGGVSGKRKLTEMVKFPLENINVELKRSSGHLARPSKKVKEQKSPKKKATRRTRSSQRQVPKINYSYMDVDCEWNPSGETKRKRKKTNR